MYLQIYVFHAFMISSMCVCIMIIYIHTNTYTFANEYEYISFVAVQSDSTRVCAHVLGQRKKTHVLDRH